MDYRHSEILAAQDLNGAGTEPIQIKAKDPISRITVAFLPVGGSVTPAGHPALSIKKLELVDGSDVLYSLTGQEGHALNIFEAPSPQITWLYWAIGGTPRIVINMDFGRRLWDEELAFDPKKFENPTIKLQHDETLWDGSCSAHSFEIWAHMFDEKGISPVGFLMSKEIKSFVGVSGGYEYTDLPTDHPIRKLIVQAWRSGYNTRNVVTDIKISEDNDKRIPIDGVVYNMNSFLQPLVGECEDIVHTAAGTAAKWIFVTPGDTYEVQVQPENQTYAVQAAGIAGNKVQLKSETGTVNVLVHVKGRDPHNCMCIPFGKQDNLDDWYEIGSETTVQLRTKGGGGAASGTTNIVTQQLRKYI